MTPEEQLEHERQIASILKIRARKDAEPSRLKMWLESNVIATLVGVIGTGLLGAWVSGIIQDRTKANEMARTAQEKRLTAQNALVEKIVSLVGDTIASTDDLLVTVNNAYSANGRKPAEIEKLAQWREKLATARDAADLAWRREQRGLGFTLQYLFGQDENIDKAWKLITSEADRFEQCFNHWYTQNAMLGTNLSPPQICKTEREHLEQTIGAFMKAVSDGQAQQTAQQT